MRLPHCGNLSGIGWLQPRVPRCPRIAAAPGLNAIVGEVSGDGAKEAASACNSRHNVAVAGNSRFNRQPRSWHPLGNAPCWVSLRSRRRSAKTAWDANGRISAGAAPIGQAARNRTTAPTSAVRWGKERILAKGAAILRDSALLRCHRLAAPVSLIPRHRTFHTQVPRRQVQAILPGRAPPSFRLPRMKPASQPTCPDRHDT